MTHTLLSISLPAQPFPSNCGKGLVHDLDLSWTPSPRVTEHALHSLQVVHPPWTKQECIPVGCVPAARRPYAGVCFPGGLLRGGLLRGVCSWGVSAPRGVSAWGGLVPGGVCSRGCAPRGVCAPRGCLLPGGSGLGGWGRRCLLWGVSALGGWWWWYPSIHWGRPPPPSVNRMNERQV